MDLLTSLKALHILAITLLLLSAAGLAGLAWQAHRRSEVAVGARLLRRPWAFAWVPLLLAVIGLPITGWWLVHLVGWPLGQTWILASSILYTLGLFSLWGLLVRLNRLRRGEQVSVRYTLALALCSGACFLVITLLTIARPA